jgi:cytochrome c oxidase subunit 4
MSARTHSPAGYVSVLVVLILLTILTIGISFIELSGFWHTILGITIGVCKAALVGLFFMHLIEGRVTTWIVVIVTAFWLIAVLMMLTFSDYATRQFIPFIPGH